MATKIWVVEIEGLIVSGIDPFEATTYGLLAHAEIRKALIEVELAVVQAELAKTEHYVHQLQEGCFTTQDS